MGGIELRYPTTAHARVEAALTMKRREHVERKKVARSRRAAAPAP